MASISLLNPKAEFARAAQALAINISAAKGLQDVMRTNLGPKGTVKMLVSGAGDIKITKDGNVLLHDMQIQHPTASMIARASTAQDDSTGDGTTTTVMLIGELLKQADIYLSEGLHPRIMAEGFEKARDKALEVLDQVKVPVEINKKNLMEIANTSLKTKVHPLLADLLTDVCVDAVLTIAGDKKQPVDLHMVELMEMQHKTDTDTQLVRGLVMDHGARHPDMPKRLEKAYILTANVSLEYEKAEVNSGFFYKTATEREAFVRAEREFIDQRVKKVIELKRSVCDGTDKTFVLINQKGIDPISLDALAKEGILALRRAKRRNMERLALACGGTAMNSFDDLQEEHLGYAGSVYEHVLGENKYTFVEDCKNPLSVTILIKGPNKHTITQIKDAIRDGLRAINNTIGDKALVPGAGAFEVRAHNELTKYKETVKGKARLAVQAFADALLVIPKTLAINSGYDAQDTIVKLTVEDRLSPELVGLDLATGEPMKPADLGVYDNYIVKKQILNSCSIIASNLLLVDEVMRAGMTSLKG
ncbi:T-complex protein 1 subunit zeta [Drosophila virilis]|uniref:T-complex polypeptide 20 n=1 Tax=Drosophila virilis TaxID=7244 RepID=O96965_DROVI|nr:T-complex protein 1 subunit zeta [Drosophila virilis]EDW63022.1 T-complex polypeptide 20 [Drosophila virilis]CAA77160.1 t-complex polypeptide 20 [Drosophila virilis]